MMSVGGLLLEAAVFLRRISDAPRLEAEVLLSHVTGIPRTSLLAHPNQALSTSHRTAYLALLHSRASGYPLPYLTQRIEFYGLEFAITPNVLIPRPETETLVDLALRLKPQVAVDVGTGSGCVAIALAAHLPDAQVYAVDISAQALRVASANARRHRVQEQVRFVRSDLVAPFAGPVDLVLSNPPYIAEDEWSALPASVRHEPYLALDGGADGLHVVRRLVAAAPRILRPGGTLLVEIGAAQGEAAAALARSSVADARVVIHQDLSGQDRVLEITTVPVLCQA